METEPFFKDYNDNPRMIRLSEMLGKDRKTIIWCRYTHEIENIYSMLCADYEEGSTVKFFGEVSKKNRELAIRRFENEATFFVANKTCAGYGLNLQFCDNVYYYSNDWDYATKIQSEDRVHRMGQETEVEITDMYAYNTIDYRVLKCLARKEQLVNEFKGCIANMKNKNDLRKWIDGEAIGEEK